MSQIRLIQLHGATGVPHRGRTSIQSLALKIPDEWMRKLKLNRGDFVLAALDEHGFSIKSIDQAALAQLLSTIEASP